MIRKPGVPGQVQLARVIGMKQSGYEAIDIAKQLGLSTKTVSHYLRISRSPDIARLVLEGDLGVQEAIKRLPKSRRQRRR